MQPMMYRNYTPYMEKAAMSVARKLLAVMKRNPIKTTGAGFLSGIAARSLFDGDDAPSVPAPVKPEPEPFDWNAKSPIRDAIINPSGTKGKPTSFLELPKSKKNVNISKPTELDPLLDRNSTFDKLLPGTKLPKTKVSLTEITTKPLPGKDSGTSVFLPLNSTGSGESAKGESVKDKVYNILQDGKAKVKSLSGNKDAQKWLLGGALGLGLGGAGLLYAMSRKKKKNKEEEEKRQFEEQEALA